MFLRNVYLSTKNLRGIAKAVSLVDSSLNIRFQNYGRFAPRKPVSIVNEDELFDVDTKNTFTKPPKAIRKAKITKAEVQPSEELEKKASFTEDMEYDELYEYQVPQKSKLKKKSLGHHKHTVVEKPGSNTSTKLYKNETLVSSLIMDLRSKKRRKKNEEILLEGRMYIKDAVDAGLIPKYIVYSRIDDVQEFMDSGMKTKFYKVPYRSIQLWSTLTTSPGIMAIFEKPLPKKISKSSLPLTIICDNVRDPGNMGTILRAAAGVGCEKIILTKGCVDFWDVKVLRSAAGAHFRVPIFASQEWEQINEQLDHDAHVFIADNNAEDFSVNRANEMSEETDLESKEKSKKELRERNFIFSKMLDLPVVPYFAVDYTKNQVILIVGGETEGLSRESLKLVENREGIRVNIPLDNKVDSLNAGMALGIVAFEIKRQFLLVAQKLNQLAQ